MVNSELIFHSQFGEDQILLEVFKNKKNGLCLEVGGNDGVTHSNSFLFESLEWKCIIIEPIPYLCEKIKSNRPDACILEFAASNARGTQRFYVAEKVEGMSTLNISKEHFNKIVKEGGTLREIKVKTDTLDHLIEPYVSQEIDFVTIDVEGAEMQVLHGFSLSKWKPRVILLEDNSAMLDTSVRDYMRKFGYINYMRTGVNDWYALENDLELINPLRIKYFNLWRQKTKLKNRIKKIVKNILPPLALKMIRAWRTQNRCHAKPTA